MTEGSSTAPTIEIVVFTKDGGPLTKRISLVDGKVKSDGSACTMARGRARRTVISDLGQLATVIEGLSSNQAIALGSLRPDLPDEVAIVTKDQVNGQDRSDVIARTGADITFRDSLPAAVLFDFDTKGMPATVRSHLAAVGGFWAALVSIIPELRDAGHLIRKSTSSGLSRADTGEALPGSDGLHGYAVARNGADIHRFLADLHDRCWLHGFGWMMVGVGGQLLDRSIIDRMVGMPERLVFEGPPILDPTLTQDADSRRPAVSAGADLDTVVACRPLTVVEKQAVKKLKAEAAQQLMPECNRAREAFVASNRQRLVDQGMSEEAAAAVIKKQARGILLANIILPFDDSDLAGTIVARVLDNPDKFDGQTLADPIEGVDYGRCKAKVMRGSDGVPWIISFAHGHTTYKLLYDARAIRDRIVDRDRPDRDLRQAGAGRRHRRRRGEGSG